MFLCFMADIFILYSVYEKLAETLDIMSDDFMLYVGHFHIVLDIFFCLI